MTWGYFADSEYTSNNLLAAGTLDLKTNDADGTTMVLNAPQLKPNNSAGPATIVLRNAGQIDASVLDISFSYLESDGPQNNTLNLSATAVASVTEVTILTYGSLDLLSRVPDINSNTYKDIQDLCQANLNGQSGLAMNESKDLIVTIKLRDGIENDFQGDGIDIIITFYLRQ